jgi:hypothetical protein
MGVRARLVKLLGMAPEINRMKLEQALPPAGSQRISFDQYAADLPQLHTWDGGVYWNSGGFEASHLRSLRTFFDTHVPAHPWVLETGAGNSTIFFLYHSPTRLVSIAPDADLFARIRAYCDQAGVSTAGLEARVGGSEWILPQIASTADGNGGFDFVLVDGCHNWPLVFVDFFYGNYLLKTGGYLMLDDIDLYPVKELVRMLSEQPGFTKVLDLGKALVFRRDTAERTLGEWSTVPYLSRKSEEARKSPAPYAL